ncbi:unnamed protein product [Phaeothamnion confervicola]
MDTSDSASEDDTAVDCSPESAVADAAGGAAAAAVAPAARRYTANGFYSGDNDGSDGDIGAGAYGSGGGSGVRPFGACLRDYSEKPFARMEESLPSEGKVAAKRRRRTAESTCRSRSDCLC